MTLNSIKDSLPPLNLFELGEWHAPASPLSRFTRDSYRLSLAGSDQKAKTWTSNWFERGLLAARMWENQISNEYPLPVYSESKRWEGGRVGRGEVIVWDVRWACKPVVRVKG